MNGARRRSRALSARTLRCIVVMALVVLMVPSLGPPAAANGVPVEYWVDPVDGEDSNPGTEGEPFKTITHAITVAGGADTIMLLSGTYGTASGETFPLLPAGESFKGVDGADVTVIEGPGAGGSGTMILNNPWIDDFIEGITFTNGGTGAGAALFISIYNGLTAADSPRVSGCVFSDNVLGTFQGGALYVAAGTPTALPLIEDCLFIGNSTTADGGAIKLGGNVSATLKRNAFVNNQAPAGGALSVVTVDAPLLCEDNYFDGNDAEYGGAVYISPAGSAEQKFIGNRFFDNDATQEGGVFWLSSTNVRMLGNDAGGNGSEGDGGFTYMWHTTVHAENNIIGGTHADDAGNVWYLNEASLYENNDTVAGSTGSSHVVFLDNAWGEFKNCIYWNPGCENEFISAHLIDHCSVTNPDVADPAKNNTLGGGNLIAVDPMMIGGDEHDPRLMLGSPCIDAADPDTAADADFFGVSRPIDGDGDGVVLPDMGACERAALKLGTYSGEDRYETAAMIALENFESADLAIVASGANFPDALSAAGLAGAYRVPLLLTRPDSAPDFLTDALDALGVSDVIIIGGEVAISASVVTALEGEGYAAERIDGADRYETAANVARRIATQMGDEFTHSAFLARGDAFPDALSVSPLAYSDRSPILLTRPGALPEATADVVAELSIAHGAVIGGTVAISAEVKTAFDVLLVANSGSASERWFGADRYATAVDVAEEGIEAGLASFDYVGVATGENYPDALAGGVAAGAHGGVVALTGTSQLPGATAGFLVEHAPVIMYVDVFGGLSAVTPAVRTAIETALGW